MEADSGVPPARTYYEILGVDPKASASEIKKQYRNKARVLHPDVGGPEEDIKLLNRAYEILKNRKLRAAYDIKLASMPVFIPPPGSSRGEKRQPRAKTQGSQSQQGHAPPTPPPPPPPPVRAPVASFAMSINQLAVSVDASATTTDPKSTSPLMFAWSWGDGQNSTTTARTAAHTYMRPGKFTISVTATNSGGSHKARKTVSVNLRPIISKIDINADGLSVNITKVTIQAGVKAGYKYEWGDGSPSSNKSSHAYARAGTYNISVTATNSGGSSAPWSEAVAVDHKPIISDVAIEVRGLGATITKVMATPQVGVTFAYRWGDGSSSDTTSHAYASPGSYQIIITASNVAGVDTAYRYIEARRPPVISNVGVNIDGLTVEIGQVDAACEPNATYSYDWGDGDGTSDARTHTYIRPGSYELKVTVTDIAGSYTKTTSFAVNRKPVISDFTTRIKELAVEITEVKIRAIPNVSYFYLWGDGSASSAHQHTYRQEGLYTITVRATNSTESCELAKVIRIGQRPQTIPPPTPVDPRPKMAPQRGRDATDPRLAQPTYHRPHQSGPRARSSSRRSRSFAPIAAWILAITLVVGGIAWGVATVRHNHAAAVQAQAAGVAAEQAVWRAPAVLSDAARDVSTSTGGGHLYYSLSLAQDAGVIVESINASTGQSEWRYRSSGQTPQQNLAAPTLVGDLVIAHDDTSVFALYAKSGLLRWRISTSNAVSVSLSSRGFVVICDRSLEQIWTYRLNTGALAWTQDILEPLNNIADISITGRQLIILRDTTMESWNLTTGRVTWSMTLGDHGNLADQGYAIGGVAYGRVIILRQSSVEAYNLSNGSLAWRVSMPMGQPQDLLVSSQAVLIVTCAQNCFGPTPLRTAYDPRSGRQLWQEAWSDSGIEPTQTHVAWLTSDTLIQWQNSPSNVWLVHARTGVIFWRRSFATIRPSSVAGNSHRLYLVDWSGAVLATAR